MRCLLCNAEMILMDVVQDDTMLVAGFEHRTFMCSACHDVERRLVFAGAATPSTAGEKGDSGPLLPPDTTPDTALISAAQDESAVGIQGERGSSPRTAG
jgi:hypothetical protein